MLTPIPHFSLRGLSKQTGISYKELRAWVGKGWLVADCYSGVTSDRGLYTMASFERAKAQSVKAHFSHATQYTGATA